MVRRITARLPPLHTVAQRQRGNRGKMRWVKAAESKAAFDARMAKAPWRLTEKQARAGGVIDVNAAPCGATSEAYPAAARPKRRKKKPTSTVAGRIFASAPVLEAVAPTHGRAPPREPQADAEEEPLLMPHGDEAADLFHSTSSILTALACDPLDAADAGQADAVAGAGLAAARTHASLEEAADATALVDIFGDYIGPGIASDGELPDNDDADGNPIGPLMSSDEEASDHDTDDVSDMLDADPVDSEEDVTAVQPEASEASCLFAAPSTVLAALASDNCPDHSTAVMPSPEAATVHTANEATIGCIPDEVAWEAVPGNIDVRDDDNRHGAREQHVSATLPHRVRFPPVRPQRRPIRSPFRPALTVTTPVLLPLQASPNPRPRQQPRTMGVNATQAPAPTDPACAPSPRAQPPPSRSGSHRHLFSQGGAGGGEPADLLGLLDSVRMLGVPELVPMAMTEVGGPEVRMPGVIAGVWRLVIAAGWPLVVAVVVAAISTMAVRMALRGVTVTLILPCCLRPLAPTLLVMLVLILGGLEELIPP